MTRTRDLHIECLLTFIENFIEELDQSLNNVFILMNLKLRHFTTIVIQYSGAGRIIDFEELGQVLTDLIIEVHRTLEKNTCLIQT